MAVLAVTAETCSILLSLVVIVVLKVGLAQDRPDYDGLHTQVNPWYAMAGPTFLIGILSLVSWGVLSLLRPPAGHRVAGLAVVAVVVAFVFLWSALRLYIQLD